MRKWNHRDCPTMPWKNGGGSTTELAIFPPGANLENFVWRLSSAQVGSAGPFSHFFGVDRSLAILSGEGLILQVSDENATRVHLEQGTLPYRFPGELAIHAELCDGPVLDLNLMTRRASCEHSMQRLTAGEHTVETEDGEQMVLYCVAGSATLPADLSLQAGDLVLFEEAGVHFQLTVDEGAILYLMRICLKASPQRRKGAKNAKEIVG